MEVRLNLNEERELISVYSSDIGTSVIRNKIIEYCARIQSGLGYVPLVYHDPSQTSNIFKFLSLDDVLMKVEFFGYRSLKNELLFNVIENKIPWIEAIDGVDYSIHGAYFIRRNNLIVSKLVIKLDFDYLKNFEMIM